MATVENHFHNHVDLDEVLKKLDHILKHQHEIMTKLTDIEVKFQELTDAIAAERTQANEKLAELQASIDELKQANADGGTEEERAALIEKIGAQVAEVKAIIPDAAPTSEA